MKDRILKVLAYAWLGLLGTLMGLIALALVGMFLLGITQLTWLEIGVGSGLVLVFGLMACATDWAEARVRRGR
jgi:hypothetical protein